MNIIEVIAQDVFDKVRSRFSNLQMGDENGAVTNEPKTARFFDFDFAIEGNNLGRVSISINERGALKLYYGQGILEGSDPITQGFWYEFLKEMRFFAKRRMLRFDTRDITKGNLNKTDFQYLATNGSKENNMNESAKMYGTPHKSYRKLENTRLVVKHSKAVDEGTPGSRSRNIEALFIENQEGERFKYPFIHLAGAKAMQRHVANGGVPYDPAGKAIMGLSEKIAQLSSFKRHASRHDGLNSESHGIVERANMKLESLKKECDMLSRQGYYESWKENFVPVEESVEIDPVTLEDYKAKFTVKHFDESLLDVFPLLHSIMQESGELDLEDLVSEVQNETTETAQQHSADAFEAFESWAESLVEGTLEPDVLTALGDLLSNGLEMGGADALGAIQALQDIGIHDETLEDLLKADAKLNPNADPSEAINKWLETTDPSAAQQLFGQAQAPEQPAPAPEEAPPEGVNTPDIPADGTPNNAGHAIGTQGGIGEGAFKDMSIVSINGKNVNVDSIQIDGMDPNDHPDYSDAYVSYAEFDDGDPLSDEEMTELTQDHPELVNQKAQEFAESEGPVGDTMTNAEPKREKVNTKEIAEVVKSFYDKETGKFPRGETGVITHCKKMFGDKGAELAERLVVHLVQKGESIAQEQEATQQFEAIKKLAGLK